MTVLWIKIKLSYGSAAFDGMVKKKPDIWAENWAGELYGYLGKESLIRRAGKAKGVGAEVCLVSSECLRNSKGGQYGCSWRTKEESARREGKQKLRHLTSFKQGKGFKFYSKCGGKPLKGSQQEVTSPGLYFTHSSTWVENRLRWGKRKRVKTEPYIEPLQLSRVEMMLASTGVVVINLREVVRFKIRWR